MAWQTEHGGDEALIAGKTQWTVGAVQCEHGSKHDSPLRPSTTHDEALIPRKTQWTVGAVQCEHGSKYDSPL